jgi:hypothetical protein
MILAKYFYFAYVSFKQTAQERWKYFLLTSHNFQNLLLNVCKVVFINMYTPILNIITIVNYI